MISKLNVWFGKAITVVIKEVLALMFGLSTVFDSMTGTVVITGKADEAGPVALPLRLMCCAPFYIVHRTNFGTDAAFDAFCAVHMEGLVGD